MPPACVFRTFLFETDGSSGMQGCQLSLQGTRTTRALAKRDSRAARYASLSCLWPPAYPTWFFCAQTRRANTPGPSSTPAKCRVCSFHRIPAPSFATHLLQHGLTAFSQALLGTRSLTTDLTHMTSRHLRPLTITIPTLPCQPKSDIFASGHAQNF